MKISIIVAMAENRVIGRDNSLPWRLSADLRRFKALTMGHHLLLGRKTFESIGRALPGREMIVVSRGRPRLPEGVHLAGSVEEAIARARAWDEDELFVAGGASIYAELLPRCDRLYLTHVHAVVSGDVLFPDVDFDEWTEESRQDVAADEDNEHASTFVVYARSRAP